MQSVLSRTYWNAVFRLAQSQLVDLTDLEAVLSNAEYSEYIPFAKLSTAVERIMAAQPHQSVGFAVGKQLSVSSHGSLGFALSSCRDLADCLDIVSRYEQTRAQFFDLTIQHARAGYVSLLVGQRHEWGTIALPLYETLLVCMYEILRFMIGRGTAECVVTLPYEKPAWAAEYETLELGGIEFAAAEFSFTLPADLLSLPSISFDAKTLQRAKQQCERELQQITYRQSLAESIREYLEEIGNYATTIDAVAAQFNVSTSTLIRRLKQENTSYKTLVEELRKQQAVELLSDQRRSLESIAYQLGYSDVSNFSRSFKRWFGCTPGVYRASAL